MKRLLIAVLGCIMLGVVAVAAFLDPPQSGTQSADRNEVKPVWACGRKVLPPEYRDMPEHRDLAQEIAKGMRKDCGIYGPAEHATPRGY
jgi:hypothetical protein